MAEPYDGYDVLAKRLGLSWDEATRRVVDRRLAIDPEPRFFSPAEWPTMVAVCRRILPQPGDRPAVPIAVYVDEKLFEGRLDGYRRSELPPQEQAWRRGLAATDAEAVQRWGQLYHQLDPARQDELLRLMQAGRLDHADWQGMPCGVFFAHRVLPDIVRAYYAHPTAWSEIGFGGPASPRGYVRLRLGSRDPWEAPEPHRDAASATEDGRGPRD